MKSLMQPKLNRLDFKHFIQVLVLEDIVFLLTHIISHGLQKKIRLNKFDSSCWKINSQMPSWIINKTLKKKIKNALIVGVAYKKDLDDTRESPAIKFLNILKKKELLLVIMIQ